MSAKQVALSTEIINKLKCLSDQNRKEKHPDWPCNEGFRHGLGVAIHSIRSTRVKYGLQPAPYAPSSMFIVALDLLLPRRMSGPWECGYSDGLSFAIFYVRSVRVRRGLRRRATVAK
jgi:hypothetical protein